MTEENASVAIGETLANDSGSADPLAGLQAYFEKAESDQIDNSTAADDTAAEEKPEEALPEKPEVQQGQGEPKTEEEPAIETEALEEAADFEALSGTPVEFLDEDGIKAKFPRNSSKEIVTAFAEVSAIAKAKSEAVEAIGGDKFVPGMTTIAKGLQEGNPRGVFMGVVESAGAEELVKVIGDAVYVGLVKADEMAGNPETAEFGKALNGIVDSALKERYGPNMSVEKMATLAMWDAAGWFEKIEKWTTDNYVSHDELSELMEVTNDPKLLAATQKIKELEGQVGQKEVKAQEQGAAKAAEVANSFGKLAADEIGKTLNDIVWKNSPLRDVKSDTADIKQEKELLRGQLTEKAVALFTGGKDASKLLEGYKAGKLSTAVFQSEFAKAINAAVLGTREQTAVAERMLAKIIGTTRNSTLARKQPQAQAKGAFQPTTSADRGQGQTETLSREQILNDMTERIAALP